MYRIVLNFGKSCVLSCLSKFDNMKKIHRAVFELKAPKAAIGHTVATVTYWSCSTYRCYGDLLCHENYGSVFTGDWAVF